MLESITLKQVATYNNTGIYISDLKKINFIYGVNGTGKTTITKFIYNPDELIYKDCLLKWKSDIKLKALVYNKDFRERNFSKGNIDGVFTLGQATREQIEDLEKKQGELKIIKSNLLKKKEAMDKLISDKEAYIDEFKETAWQKIYKKHETNFKEAFVGVMKKDSFRNRLLDETSSNTNDLITIDVLKEKAITIFGKPPENISLIQDITFDRILEIENNAIWGKKIIGKTDVDIAGLIQRLNLNDWVNEGRAFLQNDSTCPFCQEKTITNDFRRQLDDYFDETFTKDIQSVKDYSEEYNRLLSNLINELSQIETREKENGSKLKLETFSANLKTLSNQYISNKTLLENKLKEPSRSINLIKIKEQLESIKQLIDDANREIIKHNDIVNNFNSEKEKLIKAIWKFIVEENKTDIEIYNKKANGLQTGIDALRTDFQLLKENWTNLDKEIKESSKNVTSVQPSVDEINKTLKSYGFLNFQIVPSTSDINQYQIQRENGDLADSTLSEGEITFITFLYFLQLAKGSTTEDTITEERILVVDDPISSLDSNILFVISSLIKELIKEIKEDKGNIRQLILLTHNVYFHKEASFINGRIKECSQTYYWILRKNRNDTSIQSFETKNPINNSYELLWKELKNRDYNSSITIQNTMRRIIENYFKILGKYGDDDLIMKFQSKEEQEVCRSLLCWINDGSHSIPDDLFIEHQENVVDRYFEVFKDIFTHTNHIEHYKMMMSEVEA